MSDNTWPYLADQILSEAGDALEQMLDRDLSRAEYDTVHVALDAIERLFFFSTTKDGFRYFEGGDA